ncbi:hypothetical protein PVAP13_1NG114252 [Panicum virgatum]|uniref:Uncharacterized protein n=1 Tax=Panicum virgatum TaxID=38727 RepID=A0A8T0WQD1_PANVG|nr:hypothetical protein PVAP13_1NG114252 [Panicum virgatum]
MDNETLEIKQPVAQPAAPGYSPSLLTIVGSAFLAFNAATAVYSAHRGLGAIAFAAFSFLDLLLIYCLRLHETAAPPRREHLKVAVWLLATMLTFAFWPLLDFWFPIVANAPENSSVASQNHSSCAPYLPSVP